MNITETLPADGMHERVVEKKTKALVKACKMNITYTTRVKACKMNITETLPADGMQETVVEKKTKALRPLQPFCHFTLSFSIFLSGRGRVKGKTRKV